MNDRREILVTVVARTANVGGVLCAPVGSVGIGIGALIGKSTGYGGSCRGERRGQDHEVESKRESVDIDEEGR